jgi:HEAT repeat protein
MESRINHVLSEPESRQAMLGGLRSNDVGVRRRVARLLIEAGSESLPSVLKTARPVWQNGVAWPSSLKRETAEMILLP